MTLALLIGFAFGFVASIPVAGPVSALVFTSAARKKVRTGFGIALGAAGAESGYAALAFWGFGTLLLRISWINPAAQMTAAVLLMALGLYFAFRRPREDPSESQDPGNLGRGLATGFLLTALNPTLLATWSAAAGMLFSSGLITFEPALAFPFAGGGLLGIVAWFSLLLLLVRRFTHRLARNTVTRILRVTGVMMMGLSGWFAMLFVREMGAA